MGARVRLGSPVVGGGAPAAAFLSNAFARVRARCVLPEAFPISTAVGAVVGAVEVTLRAEVHPTPEGAAILYAPEGRAEFPDAKDALARAPDALRARVGDAFGFPKLYSLTPGSLPDWPITEQRTLFGLLGDVEGRLGVRLTETFLMIPRKSLSGLIFPSDRPFVSCRLCDSRDCPGRQAPYDPGAAEDHG